MTKTTTKIMFAAVCFLILFSNEIKAQKQDDIKGNHSFSIDAVAVSEKNLGFFPFFNLPDGLEFLNKPLERKYDRVFFAVGKNQMLAFEGRIWKAHVTSKETNDQWSDLYFQRSFDQAIRAVGGVKIFDGQITNEEFERYSNQATYLGEDGSIGYTDQHIKTYVIKRRDEGNIFIQLTANSAGGMINVLQEKDFKQTITIKNSDAIIKELDENQKAILYINFDLDKAVLKPDGVAVVKEIAKVLEKNKALKIDINGHTDNSGNANYNLKLSQERANAVKNELIKMGISQSRLSSKGFGDKQPIASNDTQEGKNKNRRVELIKKEVFF